MGQKCPDENRKILVICIFGGSQIIYRKCGACCRSIVYIQMMSKGRAEESTLIQNFQHRLTEKVSGPCS